MIKLKQAFPKMSAVLGMASLLGFAMAPLMAQEGHPLSGSWSGERSVGGQDSRVLLVLDLERDQVISGYLIERGARVPLEVSLQPEDWTVNIVVEGEDRQGNPLSYQVDGRIENLGSISERAIVGTWKDGADGGDFRVVLN